MGIELTLGSFFSGIGGIEQGLQAAFASRNINLTVSWQVEIDKYCQQVLQRHYPNSKKYKDIQDETLDKEIANNPTDIICFGFPCQDISVAGKGEGLQGGRSGLFFRAWELSMLVRPKYIFVENVPALTHRGLDTILGTIAESGYDAEWTHLSAKQCFAPHKRNRFWMVCYPSVAHPNSQPI